MARRKDRPKKTTPIESFNFPSMTDLVDVQVFGVTVQAFPLWHVAIDSDNRIHMFSEKPRYDRRLGRWVPQKATTIAIYLDSYHFDMNRGVSIEYDAEPIRVPPLDNPDYEIRRNLTDNQLRYLIIKGAAMGEEFILRNITRWCVGEILREEAAVRNCRFEVDESRSSTFHHYCKFI